MNMRFPRDFKNRVIFYNFKTPLSNSGLNQYKEFERIPLFPVIKMYFLALLEF